MNVRRVRNKGKIIFYNISPGKSHMRMEKNIVEAASCH